MKGIHGVRNGRLNPRCEILCGDKAVGVNAIGLEVTDDSLHPLVMFLNILTEGVDSVVQYLATGTGEGPECCGGVCVGGEGKIL